MYDRLTPDVPVISSRFTSKAVAALQFDMLMLAQAIMQPSDFRTAFIAHSVKRLERGLPL